MSKFSEFLNEAGGKFIDVSCWRRSSADLSSGPQSDKVSLFKNLKSNIESVDGVISVEEYKDTLKNWSATLEFKVYIEDGAKPHDDIIDECKRLNIKHGNVGAKNW